MELKINLATKSYIDPFQLNIVMGTALLVLISLLFYFVVSLAANAGDIGRLTRETSQLEGKGGKKEFSEKEYQALVKRVESANGIIARKTFNWLRLLDSLEGVIPEGIAITSIEPNNNDKTLKLAGIAKTFAHIRQLMETLEGTKEFTEVFLQGHSDVSAVSDQRGTAFNITCRTIIQ